MYPHITQFEENRLELQRERRLRREIREAREAQRERRRQASPGLFARVRRTFRPEPRAEPCPPLA